MLDKQIVYVTGLPRAGSTLLCQLLNMHDDIHSVGFSSPLAHIVENLRQTISNNNFFLSQLDNDFSGAYARLTRAYKGLINGWLNESNKPIAIDKNRAWLSMVQTIHDLDPNYKIIVCIRDLVQLYGSIDTQHKKTILISYADSSTTNSTWYRADQAYSPNGVVGGPLRAIENLQDIDSVYNTESNIYFMKYEDLIINTELELSKIAKFLNINNFSIDKNNLVVKKHESDSHYRFKFRHNTHSQVNKLHLHRVPSRIAIEIVQKFKWFFDHFYPTLYTEYKNMPKFNTSFGSQKQGESHGQT